MFDKKIKSLLAIKGVAAEEVTAEQLAAINAEFAENSINVSAVSAVEQEATDLETEMANMQTENTRLASELAESQASVQRLEHEVSSLKTPPGAEHTEMGEKADKVEDGSDKVAEFSIEDSPSGKLMKKNNLI